MGSRKPAIGRRDFLKGSASAAAGMLLGHGAAGRSEAAAEGSRPNIILFITDDQSHDRVGYAPGAVVQTPNLDAMAARGMIFRAGYCASMPCIPSKSCMMAGLHQHRYPKQSLGIMHDSLRENTWTWAWALRAAGYDTGMIGKMHFQPMRSQHGFGVSLHSENKVSSWEIFEENDWFDDHFLWLEEQGAVRLPQPQPRGTRKEEAEWLIAPRTGAPKYGWLYPKAYHANSWVRDRSIEFLRTWRGNRPFALVVSIRYPHPPFDPPPPFDTMYTNADVPVPNEKWTDLLNAPEEYTALRDKPMLVDPSPEMRKAYMGSTTHLDEAVGEIMEHVNLDNTVCFFTSDHGDYMGKRGRWVKSPLIPLDAIARVPFFAVGAGVPAGTTCDRPVSFMDFAPTFLRAAGLEIPPDLDGAPLQDYFADSEFDAARPVYCYGHDGFNMARRGNWKYYRHHSSGAEMLFDLENDPDEWNNIAGDSQYADRKAALAAEYDAVLSKPAPTLVKPEIPLSVRPFWDLFS